MKLSVVPAQVTTVEDRIAGSLGLSQLLLLALPVFGSSALYVILPPNMHSAPYKVVVMTALAVVCCLLAVRIKGKLVLNWLVVLSRYNLRPRYYIFNKLSMAGRPIQQTIQEEPEQIVDAVPSQQRRLLDLTTADISKVQAIIENPAANLTFKRNKKGGLRVLITEVKN